MGLIDGRIVQDTDGVSVVEKIGNLSKAANEYEWTSTAGQVVYTLPSNAAYNPNTKWLEVKVGGAPIPSSKIQKDSPTQFTLLVDSAKIFDGMKVVARWVEPYVPATSGHKSTHAAGGQDELDVTTLKGYKESVGDKIGALQTDLPQRAINVRQPPYNVKLDGTDESAKIKQAASDLNSLGGGILFFPKGEYIAHDLIPYSNMKWEGSQAILKRPNQTSSDTPKYIIGSVNRNIENFYLQGMTIDGNYKNLGYIKNGVKPTIQDVMIRNNTTGYKIKNLLFENCTFINGTNEALGVHGTYTNGDICRDVERVDVINCTFENIYGNAIFMWGTDLTVKGCKMYNVDDTGIGLDLSINTVVKDNILKYDINHTGYKYLNGVCGIAGAFFAQKETIVKDNYVVDYLIPLKVDPVNITTDKAARLALIESNFLSSPNRTSSDGLLRIMGGSKLIVRGNTINAYNNYGHGISLQQNDNSINPADIVLENNHIYDTLRAGIYGKNTTTLKIDGGSLTDCGKSGQTFPVDSIYLNTVTDFFITGVKVKNSGRDSIFVESCTDGRITNNDTTGAQTVFTSTNVYKRLNYTAGKPSTNEGFSTFSGTGVQTTFLIPHGLPSQPKGGVVTPCTATAAAPFYASFDATNINVVFTTAPATGSNNLKFSWYVFV